MTGLVDAMQAEELVVRQAHPLDRRSTLIEMTGRGRALFARMAPVHAGWIDELMAGLTASEASTLYHLLGKLKQSAREAG